MGKILWLTDSAYDLEKRHNLSIKYRTIFFIEIKQNRGIIWNMQVFRFEDINKAEKFPSEKYLVRCKAKHASWELDKYTVLHDVLDCSWQL